MIKFIFWNIFHNIFILENFIFDIILLKIIFNNVKSIHLWHKNLILVSIKKIYILSNENHTINYNIIFL